MRTGLSIKTLYRAPGKTIVTFLLLAALTFSLFLQVAEYQATAREFSENIEMYYGTAYLEKEEATFAGYDKLQYPYYIATDPRVDTSDLPDLSGFDYSSMGEEEVTELAALPYISSVKKRYMTAGRSEYPRLRDDDTLWDYNARAVIEGTLTGNCGAVRCGAVGHDEARGMRLADSTLLAGDLDMDIFTGVAPRWRFELGSYTHYWQDDREKTRPDSTPWQSPEGEMEEGEIYFNLSPAHADGDTYIYVEGEWRCFPAADWYSFMSDDWLPTAERDWNTQTDLNGIGNITLKNYPYGLEVQKGWKAGDRFVFVFRFSRVYKATDPLVQGLTLSLYDWSSEHFCPAVWNITDAPENYLELPEYAPLKKLMEITESDLNTLDVVYADDMSAIKLVHEGKMTLTDGRWLTPGDTENDAKVCMLSETFARTYGLKVGDTLPLELGDKLFEQFYNLGAVASTVERYADNWTDAKFEIVGLYKGKDPFSAAKEPNWSYSVNTVFVPLSSLPETADTDNWELAPGEYTFRVDNAWDIAPFLEETAPQIAAMGLTLSFDDGGWMEVYQPYVEARRISLIRIALLAVVTVMVTAFVVYLFISRKRKDYAIMRALGTPKRRSGAALLLPLMVLAVVSVIVGLAAAMLYIGSMGKLAQPPLGIALLCGVAELLLALLLALAMLHRLSRRSPLALLQGGTRQ